MRDAMSRCLQRLFKKAKRGLTVQARKPCPLISAGMMAPHIKTCTIDIPFREALSSIVSQKHCHGIWITLPRLSHYCFT